jgi:hypothetical protein
VDGLVEQAVEQVLGPLLEVVCIDADFPERLAPKGPSTPSEMRIDARAKGGGKVHRFRDIRVVTADFGHRHELSCEKAQSCFVNARHFGLTGISVRPSGDVRALKPGRVCGWQFSSCRLQCQPVTLHTAKITWYGQKSN